MHGETFLPHSNFLLGSVRPCFPFSDMTFVSPIFPLHSSIIYHGSVTECHSYSLSENPPPFFGTPKVAEVPPFVG